MRDATTSRLRLRPAHAAALGALLLLAPGGLHASLPPLPMPEPVVTSFAFVERPGPEGRFLVEVHVQARHRLDPVAFGVIASDGVSLETTDPLFVGSLDAGESRTLRVGGTWERRVEGATVSLALEYRYPAASLREEVRRRGLGAADPGVTARIEARIRSLAARGGQRVKALPLGATGEEREP